MIILVLSLTACQQKNKLDQDERAIINELVQLGEVIDDPMKNNSPHKNLNIPEQSRLLDPNNPLIVLDIIKARFEVQNVKLRDLYAAIKYVPIRFPYAIDTLINTQTRFEFVITPNNIFASNQGFGITQFDVNGQYIRQIVQNKFHYTYDPKYKMLIVMPEDRAQFVGSKRSIYSLGDKLYYQFDNVPDNTGFMMEYDASPGVLAGVKISDLESSPSIPFGKKLFEIDITEKPGRSWSLSVRDRIPISRDYWLSTYGKTGSSSSGSFLCSTNLDGDTITKFADHDPVKGFTGSVLSSLDHRGTQYIFKGIQHIRQTHNDTIYAIYEPNKLVAKYVIDFGNQGIKNATEGIDPNFSLKNKFIPEEFIETELYLFIIYKQYEVPSNNSEKDICLYNACIYDKRSGHLFHIYKDKTGTNPGSPWDDKPKDQLRNNYDHGPAFWPKSTTYDGKPFTWFKKQHISHEMTLQYPEDIDYLLMIAY
jgi:hypothetical protein